MTIGAAAPAQVAPRRRPRLSPEQANTSPILRCQAHLLEVDGPQVDDIYRQLIEPTAEAGSTDNGSAAVVAARAKRNSAAGNRAVGARDRVVSGAAEIESGQRLAPVVRDQCQCS